MIALVVEQAGSSRLGQPRIDYSRSETVPWHEGEEGGTKIGCKISYKISVCFFVFCLRLVHGAGGRYGLLHLLLASHVFPATWVHFQVLIFVAFLLNCYRISLLSRGSLDVRCSKLGAVTRLVLVGIAGMLTISQRRIGKKGFV